MMKGYWSIFLLTLCLVSCRKTLTENKEGLDKWTFEKQISPIVSVVNKEVLLIDPVELDFVGKYVIVYDPKSTAYCFTSFEKESGEIAFKFGAKGKGPGELAKASDLKNDLLTTPNGGILKTFDKGRKTFIDYTVEFSKVSFKEKKAKYFNIKTLQVKGGDLLILNPASSVGNYRFSLMDSSNKLKNEFIAFPASEKKGTQTKNERSILTNSVIMEFNPSRTTLVFGTNIGTRLEIFDVSGLPENILNISTSQINSGAIKSLNFPFNSKALNVAIPDRKSQMGFRDIQVTEKYIYGVHINHIWDDLYTCCNSIKVFDLNGAEVQEINLQAVIYCIAVNEEDNVIYAIISDDRASEMKLVKFPILQYP